MEFDFLQIAIGFGIGLLTAVIAMLIFNKARSGSVSAAGVKQEYDDYRSQVEEHFEETSKKFQNMTEQYQDLYEHLSLGATSLCSPGSVAAELADQSESVKPKPIESKQPQESEHVHTSQNGTSHSMAEKEIEEVFSGGSVEQDLEAGKNEITHKDADRDNKEVENRAAMD